jgi:hypothetical protein
MSNEELIARVHQRAQLRRRGEQFPSGDVYEYLVAVHDLLTDLRRKLPVLIATADGMLEPVTIIGPPRMGRGFRAKRVYEDSEQSAGWRILSYKQYSEYGSDTQRTTVSFYFLIDGRLSSAAKILDDDQFIGIVAGRPEAMQDWSFDARPKEQYLAGPPLPEMIVVLCRCAGLPAPQLPRRPILGEHWRRAWESIIATQAIET